MVVQAIVDGRETVPSRPSDIVDEPTGSDFAAMLTRLADRITEPGDISNRVRLACEHVIRVCPTAVSSTAEMVIDGVVYRYSLVLPSTSDGVPAAATTPVNVLGSAVGTIDVVTALTLDADSASMIRSIACALGSPVTAYMKLTAAEANVASLRAAMHKRAPVEQAKGMLMAVHRIDADAAFGMLVTRSQRENRKVRDVASDIIDAFAETGGV